MALKAWVTIFPASSAAGGFVHLIPQVPWLTLPHLDVGLEHAARAEYELGVQAWNLRQPEQGLELFLRSAQKGHQVGEYCFRYGMYHELPPSDMIQAFRWYKRGARMNHKGSTTMLGKLHLAAGHRDLAVRFLRRTGLPLGVLGPAATEADVLERGHGGWRGDSLAQWFLGELFLQSAKLRDAVKWWKLSAENGDSDAMMRLSQVFSDGANGIPQEPMRARHWLFAAAAHGHKDALDQVDWSATFRPRAEQRWIDLMEGHGWL